MTDARPPLWDAEESVEARAQAGFAFRYMTDVQNMKADRGVERVETDGPFRPGMRGTTYLAGGGSQGWWVAELEPERRYVIEAPLDGATLRFEWRFEERTSGGSLLTQRVSLCGPNAAAYREGVEAGFGGTLREGMRAVRDRIDEAARGAAGDRPRLEGPVATARRRRSRANSS